MARKTSDSGKTREVAEGREPAFADPAERIAHAANVQLLRIGALEPETREEAKPVLPAKLDATTSQPCGVSPIRYQRM